MLFFIPVSYLEDFCPSNWNFASPFKNSLRHTFNNIKFHGKTTILFAIKTLSENHLRYVQFSLKKAQLKDNSLFYSNIVIVLSPTNSPLIAITLTIYWKIGKNEVSQKLSIFDMRYLFGTLSFFKSNCIE